ncbi:hypothetical protein PTKIN_Ptkin13bG0134800 [Pterospermum kingtungense]
MDASFQELSLSDDDESELRLDLGDDSGQSIQVQFCLVGRFLTDRSINFQAMKNRMAVEWRPGKGVNIKEVEPQLFLFQFFHEVDVKRIMEGGPWSFDSHSLILHRLMPSDIPSNVPLFSVAFWVRIYDLPVGFMSMSVGKQLDNYIGEFIEYNANNSSSFWRAFMWIQVELDVRKPLKKKKKKKITGPGGVVTFVHFKYERPTSFCFLCGLLGHSEPFCAFYCVGVLVKEGMGT